MKPNSYSIRHFSGLQPNNPINITTFTCTSSRRYRLPCVLGEAASVRFADVSRISIDFAMRERLKASDDARKTSAKCDCLQIAGGFIELR